MLLSALLEKAKIEYSGADATVSRVICDSREAAEETLFVCITGFASDGHAYAKRAYDLGCRVFAVEKEVDLPEDAIVIMQDNTRITLARLAAAYYDFPSQKLKVVGITGTKGKTTTALMLAAVLNKNGISAGYIGSNGIDFAGNHYETKNTTPESLDLHYYFKEMVDAGVKAVVIEVSSQALYLDRVYGIEFFATAFTNLAPDHIGGVEHPTFEHYRDSKKRLFVEYPSMFSIYNAEDAESDYMLGGCRSLLCSFGLENGDFHASGIKPFMENGVLGVEFDAYKFTESQHVRLPMPGDFSVANSLCAMAIAHRFEISLADCAAALESAYVFGRFEIVQTKLDSVFVIDYAHNGFSLTSALDTLKKYSPNRLWCVVGSVGGRTRGRRAELGEVASKLSDIVVLTADNPDFEDPLEICNEMHDAFVRDVPCEIFSDREDAIKYVLENVKKNDIVLFAGKGHEQYQLIRGGKIPFSERRLIEKYALELARV
ncbi:MAG: UDP-N-acetylmuramoyl-L-alanyl-D-glutamate--2,6-diaminopimelate ligase [Ruminococcaceae bacterium]|nr:UDP-N-acetylmuramoyl-L-alanyl-D-glutamate--2,6-diaminopimelate ligase [Oscillospiraceae bacterium]